MATREKMVFDLTRHELERLSQNNTSTHIDQTARFFIGGGFDIYSDVELERQYSRMLFDEVPE
jgi:hypothetical protein